MPTPFKVKAIYDYSSPHDDDLNFSIGQVITVTDDEEEDWYGGEYIDDDGVKHEGIFPRNFVEKFEPTAPPRPTRTRTKKAEAPSSEPEPAAPAQRAVPPPPPPTAVSQPPATPAEAETEDTEEPEEPEEPEATTDAAPRPVPVAPKASIASPELAPTTSVQDPHRETAAPVSVPVPVPATKARSPAPPPVSEKPSSFKDRIAAFNKADAAPVAPFKPGRLTGTDNFIKKPFVPPPPSRNAFVPAPREPVAPKIYRREEDPEIREQETENLEQAEKAGLVPAEASRQEPAEEEGDQPKPTSLKERIALLQKQQQEQAQRHAEAAAKKKEPPKKPVKKRVDPPVAPESSEAVEEDASAPVPLQRTDTETTIGRTSSEVPRSVPPPRRRSSKGPAPAPIHDGNEADMSGAGDTTEGQYDTSERDDEEEEEADVKPIEKVLSGSSATGHRQAIGKDTAGDDQDEEAEEVEAKGEVLEQGEVEEEEEEEEEEDVDPEVRRKEELRARMAKMSGGMGFAGMFGGPPPPIPAPVRKKTSKPKNVEEDDEASSAMRSAPPIPTAMALPGMGGSGQRPSKDDVEPQGEIPSATNKASMPPIPSRGPHEIEEAEQSEDDDDVPTPHVLEPPNLARQVPPPPSSRPVPPPPVPSESRPPPPPPPADLRSASDGSQSGDELSGGPRDETDSDAPVTRSPPLVPQAPGLPIRSPPLSPREENEQPSFASKRTSRPPPPIPGNAPAVPPPATTRPPPPPPPGASSQKSAVETTPAVPSRPTQAGDDAGEEGTEYEGDYDTDIASSVPHKEALKAHTREPSVDDETLQSPIIDAVPDSAPPLAPASSPRSGPPPLPSQLPPVSKRTSLDVPRAAPPPPPPVKDRTGDQDTEEYDPYNHSVVSPVMTGTVQSRKTPKIEEETYFGESSPSVPQPQSDRRVPPTTPGARNVSRQSIDASRPSMGNRRSLDMHRQSLDSGFIANDIDLAAQSGWWKQSNQLPPYLQGRRDIYFESDESTSTNQGSKTVVTRQIFVLFLDYSQTIIRVSYDPYDPSDVEMDQRHEPPPRALRQDEMEEFYDRFGRLIAEAASSRKDSVVGDGTPQGFVLELLRPLNGALWPIGTRSFGALVYSNMANASTQQHDIIRPGDIISIRNGKFQGKHGPMHAKYSAEVGKPDHVAVVAEWDGTKKKVRAWEQGRENKKVKIESYKLEDLRSGEVKIWRVVPRSWVGWNSQP